MKSILLLLVLASSDIALAQNGHIYILNLCDSTEAIKLDGTEVDIEQQSYVLRNLAVGLHRMEWKANRSFWHPRWSVLPFTVQRQVNYYFVLSDGKNPNFTKLSESEGQGYIRDMRRQIDLGTKNMRNLPAPILHQPVYLPPWETYRR